jgi:hypothetical protein
MQFTRVRKKPVKLNGVLFSTSDESAAEGCERS